MIYEVAHLTVDLAKAAAFEVAVAGCAPLFRAAHGCRSMRLERVIENPACYRLVVGWDTVDDHLVGFRQSPAFARWREEVGPFFAEPPQVVHTEIVAEAF